MSSSFSSSPFHSSSSSCVPPRQQSTLSVAISALRQSSTYQAPTLSTPTASNTNTLFLLLAFSGHGAELLKQETADPASNLRVILQAACEYDIVEMIRHLGISVHNIRAIGGAPATNLVIRQKFVVDGGATNPGSGNRVTSSQSLFCGVMIRATSPQQCKAISISLKAAITNPYNYRHMQKLIGKVCRSRPTRLFGDVKARTPYFDSNNLFVSVCRMDEISQNVNNQPRWFIDFFASPSHMVHPSAVDRFLIDEETAQQRAKDMLITKRNGNNSHQRDGASYYVNYSAQHQQRSLMTADEERFHRHHHQHQESLLSNNNSSSSSSALMMSPKRSGNNNSNNGTILASDDDAMFVPMTMMAKRQQQNNNNNHYGASRMLTVDQVAAAAAEGEPIVLSRHYT